MNAVNVDEAEGQSSMATLHQPRRTKNNELDPVYHNLPRQSLPKSLSVGDFLDVIVAEVFSPGHFFIQAKETSGLLDKMMDSMEEFYYKNHQKERYRITDLSVGLICVSLFNDGNWYRASVTKVVDDILVEVFYVDYGTISVVEKSKVCHLDPRFQNLPAQAIKAKLAGIEPSNCIWTKESSRRFLELVQSPSQAGGLVSVVFELSEEGLSLCLVDTVTNDKVGGVDINQVLVDEGLAVGSLEQRKNISRLQSDEIVPLRRPFLQTGVGRVQKTDEENEISHDSDIVKKRSNTDKEKSLLPVVDPNELVSTVTDGAKELRSSAKNVEELKSEVKSKQSSKATSADQDNSKNNNSSPSISLETYRCLNANGPEKFSPGKPARLEKAASGENSNINEASSLTASQISFLKKSICQGGSDKSSQTSLDELLDQQTSLMKILVEAPPEVGHDFVQQVARLTLNRQERIKELLAAASSTCSSLGGCSDNIISVENVGTTIGTCILTPVGEMEAGVRLTKREGREEDHLELVKDGVGGEYGDGQSKFDT